MTDPAAEPADYEQPDEAVTVEQCDRDAAAWAFTIPGPDGDRLRDHFARAFARHRTQANEAMRAALERIAATDFDSPPWQAVEAEIKQIALSALSGDSA